MHQHNFFNMFTEPAARRRPVHIPEALIHPDGVFWWDPHNRLNTTSLSVSDTTGVEHRAVMRVARRHWRRIAARGYVQFEIQLFATRGGRQRRVYAVLDRNAAEALLELLPSEACRAGMRQLRAAYESKKCQSPEISSALPVNVLLRTGRPFYADLATAVRAWVEPPDTRDMPCPQGTVDMHLVADRIAEVRLIRFIASLPRGLSLADAAVRLGTDYLALPQHRRGIGWLDHEFRAYYRLVDRGYLMSVPTPALRRSGSKRSPLRAVVLICDEPRRCARCVAPTPQRAAGCHCRLLAVRPAGAPHASSALKERRWAAPSVDSGITGGRNVARGRHAGRCRQ